jgi:hypothetical protein
MSTAEQKSAKRAGRAERDPQMYNPLDRLRGIIRRYVVIEGALTAVLFVALWFSLGLVLDYGLFKASGWDWAHDGSWWVRALALAVAAGLLVAILVTRIVTRLTTEFSYAALALVLERRFPKLLGDRLITAVEMADVTKMAKFGYSEEMLLATIDEARERVGKVPVSEVFNWRRLWVLGFLTVGVLAATLAASFASYAIATRSLDARRFGWKFAHVSGIFLERNAALMNTPWPRRAHLELVGFPDDGELNIGREVKPPIKARAYRWVVADRAEPFGWRPLRWSDLTPEFVGRPVPELPPSFVTARGGSPSLDALELYAYDSGAEPSPEEAKVREAVKLQMGSGYDELQGVFRALFAKADDPSMGRTLRRLDLTEWGAVRDKDGNAVRDAQGRKVMEERPIAVRYKFRGKQTAGDGDLAPEKDNVFSGEISGLKEDVEFVVKAADFATPAKRIRLIPPPSLKRLGREQAEPAYLHHAPPADEGYGALKGRLQKVAAKDLSLTGEETVFAVPAGTELTLVAESFTADDGSISPNDRIVRAVAQPISGRFPGTVFKDGKPTQAEVPLEVAGDGEGFRIAFRGAFRLTDNVKFKLAFTNKYNIAAHRTITIQVTQDQPPTVEVAVDVIRKVGNVYLVTPRARIPFNPDSFVKDDHGLSKVEYTFNYYAEDSDIVRAYRVKYALRALLQPPLPGTPAAPLALKQLDNFRLLDKADDRRATNLFGVSAFNEQVNKLRRDTREQFEQALANPRAEDAAAQAVLKVELNQPGRDYIDLDVRDRSGSRVFDLLPKGDGVQTIYRMDVNVQATDSNVDNEGGPRVTRNAEPIRLRIVSEGDLLNEIGKEEEQLATRLDEALTKLAAARKKYEFVRSNNGAEPNPPPEHVDAVKVRAQDALGDVEKARDIVASVVREMRRLQRECEVNRINEGALNGYRSRTERLNTVLSEAPDAPHATFPRAQGLMNQVQNPLNAAQWAPPGLVSGAQNALYALEELLKTIRTEFREVQSKEKLKQELIKIKDKQARIRQEVVKWQDYLRDLALKDYPTFGEVGVLSLAKGESKPVSQTIQWNQYKADDIAVKLTVFDAAGNAVADALAIPSELKLNFEQHQFRFNYEVKALNREGTFKIRLTPAVGPAKEIQVIVK